MPTAFDEQRVTILRQRVRGNTPDPLLTRLRLENLLGSADLRPSGLPPSAILCVRELRDPMPGALRLSGYMSQLPQRWEQALHASLDDVVRSAARPLHQSVPGNADAVIFADRAEMLACLALDWTHGTLPNRWWWRSLLRHHDLSQMVWSAWLETPRYIPPALAHLAARGFAAVIVNRIDESVVNRLLSSVLQTFQLSELMRAIYTVTTDETPFHTPPAPPMVSTSLTGTKRDQASDNSIPVPSSGQVVAPWADRVPESLHESLTIPCRLLLGVALSLTRDPARIRTASFAWQTQRWMQAESAATRELPSDRTASVRSTNDNVITDENSEFSPTPSKEIELAGSPTTNDLTQSERSPENHELLQIDSSVADDTLQEGVASQTAATPTPELENQTGTPIETHYGGLFYLLNLAVYLGFYGDYATPRQHELELSIWDFVALVGAELLGAMPPDPIWALLAQFAGRDDDNPPGTHFVPPDNWNVDPRWLNAFPEQTGYRWSQHNGRLRILHPLGFLLVDTPLQADLGSQLDEFQKRYNIHNEMSESTIAAELEPPLRRWLNWLMPYIRARLCRALGLNEGDDPAVLLCEHHARIFVTPAHVDVMLDLDTLPIEIRLAGLDRDPGWLPAAGKTISFHFESNGG